MKANELKVADLMVGDWVICYHPSRLKSFEKVSVGLLHTMQEQECGHIKEDSPLFRIVEPVPLTPEILEKNGFVKGDTMDLGDEIYCVKLFNIHYDNEEREFWVCNFFESGYGTGINDIFQIKYVHELQHALRLCKVDKEIVL